MPDSLQPFEPIEFGPYSLVALAGEGGMASVYRAVRSGPMGFRKEVAIKRIRADLTRGNDRLVEALINEARLGGELRHANIVDVYEFGEVGEEHYIAMEFVNGLVLDALLEGMRQRNTKLPTGAAFDLVLQVCAGLDYAHGKVAHDGVPMNLVHRDLKPSNIAVTTEGLIKLMDFGIARADTSLHKTTTAGVIKGTIAYMSPEQLDEASDLDRRSDIFAMGVILFELLTGELLHTRQSVQKTLLSIVQGSFMDRLGVAEEAVPGSGPILERCLRVDRKQRYGTARELANDILSLREERGDNLGCTELMTLVDSYINDPPDAFAAVSSEVLTRDRSRATSSGWPHFVQALPEDQFDGEDHLLDGLHPSLDALSLAQSDAFEREANAPMKTSVMWQAPDAAKPEVLPTVVEPITPGRARPRWWLSLVVVAIVLGAVVGYGWVLRSRAPTDEPQPHAEEALAEVDEGEVTAAPSEAPTDEAPSEAPGEEPGEEPGETPTEALDDVAAEPTPAPPVEDPTPEPPTPDEFVAAQTVPIWINAKPWAKWRLTGDTQAEGNETPFKDPLPPGSYTLTLTCGTTGEKKAVPFEITGQEPRYSYCYDFNTGSTCTRGGN